MIKQVCAEESPEAFLFWLNTFGWTFNPRLKKKHVPFITWEIQDKAATALWNAIYYGEDVLFDKSRDMGASWLCIAAFVWFWWAIPDTPLLVGSRKEDLVDAKDNPDTLFWKIDYLIENLPDWMRPNVRYGKERTHKHLANPDNGSVIDGEATNPDFARGGRRKAILLDEFAAVDNGGEILSATADTTPCRVFNSTPKGKGNAFANVRWSGKVLVITLPWWEHPTKGEGRQELTLADGTKKYTSPWYEKECARRTSKKEIAQELDIDYLASGDAFFDLNVCQMVRGRHVKEPISRGELDFCCDTRAEARYYVLSGFKWQPGGRGRMALWIPLVPDKDMVARPTQKRNYVTFCDISHGQGASNSVAAFADTTSREVVGLWVCPDTPPHDFARQVVALCRWFGGQNNSTYLGWEANGPGGISFGREIYRLGYRNVLGNKNPNIPWEPDDKSIGWQSNRPKKQHMLSELDKAMARNELILHDNMTVSEIETYIIYPSGEIGPSGILEDTSGARANHGDRVIATAGLVLCLGDGQLAVGPPPVTQPGSFNWRREAYDRGRRRNNEW